MIMQPLRTPVAHLHYSAVIDFFHPWRVVEIQ